MQQAAPIPRETLALTLIRISLGGLFVLHGFQKLFGGLEPLSDILYLSYFNAPNFLAVTVTVVEFAAGLALVTGTLTRWAAFVVIFELGMTLAFTPSHLVYSQLGHRGYEEIGLVLVMAVVVMLSGPAAFAVDNRLAAE